MPPASRNVVPWTLLAGAAIAAAFLILILALTNQPGAPSATATRSATTPALINGTQFRDKQGRPIQAHGGGALFHGGVYYWVGENRTPEDKFGAVSLYSSTDLATWTFRGNILTPASSSELRGANIERPKLIYNAATKRFVLWMHWENGTDYSSARVAVASSARVDGHYIYGGSFRPAGYESRDQTVFTDDDGTDYLVSAAASNADLHIYRLTPDGLHVDQLIQRLFLGKFREAPAVFKRGNTYFMVTSAATGWNPNQAMYATASSVSGPWSELSPLGDSTTYGSQAAYILPTRHGGFLYMGDRWAGAKGGPVNASTYVWLPLQFPAAKRITMSWQQTLTPAQLARM